MTHAQLITLVRYQSAKSVNREIIMYRTSEIVFVKPGLTDTSRNMFTFDQEDDMKTLRLAL